MKIFETLEEIRNIEPAAVALGNFDGVHLGHQELIRQMVNTARERGLKAAVFTFSNHPKDLLPKEKKVKNILNKKEKAQIIESLGVDYLFNIEFTKAIMTMEPITFINTLLLEKFNMKAAFCGFNYHFGYKAQGTPDVLRNVGMEKGFDVTEMSAYKIKGNIVSSSMISVLIIEELTMLPLIL